MALTPDLLEAIRLHTLRERTIEELAILQVEKEKLLSFWGELNIGIGIS
jgi:hypothetical protein